VLLLGEGAVVAACSSTVATPGTGASASQTVGASGGTVTASDGTEVVIPPGALTSNVTITIAANPSAPALTQATPLKCSHRKCP
jgi:hypothetical protein